MLHSEITKITNPLGNQEHDSDISIRRISEDILHILDTHHLDEYPPITCSPEERGRFKIFCDILGDIPEELPSEYTFNTGNHNHRVHVSIDDLQIHNWGTHDVIFPVILDHLRNLGVPQENNENLSRYEKGQLISTTIMSQISSIIPSLVKAPFLHINQLESLPEGSSLFGDIPSRETVGEILSFSVIQTLSNHQENNSGASKKGIDILLKFGHLLGLKEIPVYRFSWIDLAEYKDPLADSQKEMGPLMGKTAQIATYLGRKGITKLKYKPITGYGVNPLFLLMVEL